MNKNLVYIVSEDWYFLSHRLALARNAMRKGFNVFVVCKNTGKLDKIKSYGFKCYELNASRNNTSIVTSIKELINIRLIIKTIKPSIVHLVALRPIIMGLIGIILINNIKVVSSITGMGSIFLSKNLKIRFLKYFIFVFLFISFKRKKNNIIVQNKDDYNFFLKKFNINKNRIFLIRGSGVDTNYFNYVKEPSVNSIIVTFVGRLIKDKGIETLFEAFKKVKNKNIYLLIAGNIDTSNPSAITEKYINSELKKNKNISWLGEVKNIKKLWEKSHIAILLSKREGLPKSLLEAAASGRAIIATDVAGCREIAINNYNAITVKLDNVDELAAAIRYLATNHGIRKQFGIESRKLVEKDMSDEIIINKTISIYESLYKSLNTELR